MITDTTASILWSIISEPKALRAKMDNYMYMGEKPLLDEDWAQCREVYDSICKTLDLL